VTVSVLVVNWNRKELLRKCLNSLLSQEIDTTKQAAGVEIIVIDNLSTDGSVDMLRHEFAQVTVIENTSNIGFCAANNQGLALACGQFIALLNNDAEASPAWLAELLKAFEGRDDIGMAASKIVAWDDPRRIDKVGHLIYPDGQNGGRGAGQIDRGQFEEIEEVLWPDGCAAMYRKSMLDQIGGFDEDLFAYADDAELGLRARIAGWKCLYMPKALVRHHRGSTLGRGNPNRIRLIERNRILLAAKLFPWSLLVLNPFYFAMRVLSGLRFVARAEGGDLDAFAGIGGKLRLLRGLLHGQWQALWMLPRFLAKRREVQALAKLSPGEIRQLIMDNRLGWAALVRAREREVTS
jgi:GT2 family glycosyltransferase